MLAGAWLATVALLLPACTTEAGRAGAIAWQRQACERIADADERARCLARVEAGLRDGEARGAR